MRYLNGYKDISSVPQPPHRDGTVVTDAATDEHLGELAANETCPAIF
jgi:hypothetical protein